MLSQDFIRDKPQYFKANNESGEFELNTPMVFGKYKGKTLTSIAKTEMVSYLRWMTHALTAEKFICNLSKKVIEYTKKTSDGTKCWIDGEMRDYQMGNWYLTKIGTSKGFPVPNLDNDGFGIGNSKGLLAEKKLQQSINNINKLLEDL